MDKPPFDDWQEVDSAQRILKLEYLFALGEANYHGKDYEGAIACLSDAIALMDATQLDWRTLTASERKQLLKAIVNRGTTYEQSGNPQQAITDYSDAIARMDATQLDWRTLTASEREELLMAMVNRGFTYEQSGNPQQAITNYGDAIARMDATQLDWRSLTSVEREFLLTSFYRRGLILANSGNIPKALANYNDILARIDTTKPDFPIPNELEIELLLVTLIQCGVLHSDLSNTVQEINYYTRAIELIGSTSINLKIITASARGRVLNLFLLRGIAHYELGSFQQAISDFEEVLSHIDLLQMDCRTLTTFEREQLLGALVYRGVTYGKSGDMQKEISDYSEAIARMSPAELDWCNLSALERTQLLKALLNRGNAYAQLGDMKQGIANFSEAIARIDATKLDWWSLTAQERDPLLKALVNRSSAHIRLGNFKQAIDNCNEAISYINAIELNLQLLTPSEHDQLLKALFNRAYIHHQLGDSIQTIADCQEAHNRHFQSGRDAYPLNQASFSIQYFFTINHLIFIVLAGLAKELHDPRQPAQKIFLDRCHQQLHSADIYPFAQYWLKHQGLCPASVNQASLRKLAVVTYRDGGRPAKLLWKAFQRALHPPLQVIKRKISQHEASIAQADRDRLAFLAFPEPKWRVWRWLEFRRRQGAWQCSQKAITAKPSNDDLEQLCRNLAYDLASTLWRIGDLPDGPEDLGAVLLTGAAYVQARTSQPDWPNGDQTLWSADAPPCFDEAYLGKALELDNLSPPSWDVNTSKNTYEVIHHEDWLRKIGGVNLGQTRSRPFIAFIADWEETITLWQLGQKKPLQDALARTWALFHSETEKLRREPEGNFEHSPLSCLARYLLPWLVTATPDSATQSDTQRLSDTSTEPAQLDAFISDLASLPAYRATPKSPETLWDKAINRAQNGILSGAPVRILANAIEAHLLALAKPALENTSTDENFQKLRAVLLRIEDALLLNLPSLQGPQRLREVLHGMVQAQIGAAVLANDADLIWELLETSRLALSSVRWPGELPKLDYAAEARLKASLDYELARAQRLLMPEIDTAPQADDGLRPIFPPFVVLEEEYRRLGALPFPEIATCANKLKIDEALVQLFFTADGTGVLLWLLPDASTQVQTLPEQLSLENWQPLLDAWRSFYACSRSDGFDQWFRAQDYAWHSLGVDENPASTLLRMLADTAPAYIHRWCLILPADLARIPWLAWVEGGPESAIPAPFRRPGALTLDTCVSAWAGLDDDGLPPSETIPSQRVLVERCHATPLDKALANAEANQVAKCMDSSVAYCEDFSLLSLLNMLSESSPVHWIMHGKFQHSDPQASYLHMNGPGGSREVPAWLLSEQRCLSPVSLSSCYSMLTGSDIAGQPLLGPVGIGPLLRARGAPWVIGPLWESDMLASAVFYDAFYTALPKHSARKALSIAMQQLRDMESDRLLAWARQRDQEVENIANEVSNNPPAKPGAFVM